MNAIMDTTKALRLSEKRLFGSESKCNCKLTQLQVLGLLMLFPCFMIRNANSYGKTSLPHIWSCTWKLWDCGAKQYHLLQRFCSWWPIPPMPFSPFVHHLNTMLNFFTPWKGAKKHIIKDVEIGKNDLILGGESTFSGKRSTPLGRSVNPFRTVIVNTKLGLSFDNTKKSVLLRLILSISNINTQKNMEFTGRIIKGAVA